MPTKILVVDIEATGLEPSYDEIVEIGIAKLDLSTGKITKVFDKVIKPKGEYDRNAWIFENTSLTPEMVDNAEPLKKYFLELYSLLANNVVTSYNLAFDIRFLRANGFDVPYLALDPMDIATNVLKIPHSLYGYKFPKFKEAYEHYFGFGGFNELHRAYDDAHHEAKLIFEMIKRGDFTLNH